VPRDPVMAATQQDIDRIKKTFDQLGIRYK
jgi:4-hydroxy-tetrahydrodipicolinate synthase